MIRHIVMFRLKEYQSREEKEKASEELLGEMMKLPVKIDFIRTFEAGINISREAWAFDLVLDSTFDSPEDLERYHVHPAHRAFVLFNKNYSVNKVVVDFEMI